MNTYNNFKNIIKNGNTECLKKFMEKHHQVINGIDYNTGILIAVKYEKLDILNILLTYKNYQIDCYYNDAIEYSVKKGDLNTTKLLLEDNRVNYKYKNYNFIKTAIYEKHFEIIKYLMNDHRFFHRSKVQQSTSILFSQQETEIFSYLINECNVFNKQDLTILFIKCAYYGYQEIFDMLIEKYDIDKSAFNNQAILAAFENKNDYIFDVLWQDEKVKSQLVKGGNIYNYMIAKEAQKKAISF